MANNKFLTTDESTGGMLEVSPITTSAGSGDASKIAQTDSTGKFDITLMPVGVGQDAYTIVASEALAAGDFVNIWNDVSVVKVRKADASSASKLAHGYVLAAVTLGNNATVFDDYTDTQLSGLTVGTTYFLSPTTPGAVTATVPTTSGHIVQRLGVATSATALKVDIKQPIKRA